MKPTGKLEPFLNGLSRTSEKIDRLSLFDPRSRLIATTRLNPRIIIPSDRHATLQVFTAFQRLSRPYNRPIEIYSAIQEGL